MSEAPLILIPGMGADERLFRLQKPAFPNLIVPPWIPPQRGESLPAYAARFAKHIDPGVPFFIGGVSLGGMIAAEIARQSKAPDSQSPALTTFTSSIRGCFLIASIRGPDELPRRARMFGAVMPLTTAAITVVPILAKCLRATMRCCLTATQVELLDQLAAADPAFLCWAARAILTWKTARSSASNVASVSHVPIFQIHGDRDRIVSARCTRPDQLIAGGGHIDLTLTHAEEVNRFLRAHLK